MSRTRIKRSRNKGQVRNQGTGFHGGLTPELRQKFAELLFTWSLRQAQRKVRIPSPQKQQSRDWQKQYEAAYGDGQFEHRLEMLNVAIKELENVAGMDFNALYKILSRAKRDAFLSAIQGSGMKAQRYIVTKRTKVRTNLKYWANEAIRFIDSLSAEPGGFPELTEPFRAILKTVDDNLLLNPSSIFPDSKYRHSQAGRQPRPWLAEARSSMAKLKVPTLTRIELLKAVGLTPLHPTDI